MSATAYRLGLPQTEGDAGRRESSLAAPAEPVPLRRAPKRLQFAPPRSAEFQRIPSNDAYHITNGAFHTAIALHLSLPIAGFEGSTCLCNDALTGAGAARHISSCTKFNKLDRSETFQHAFDSIMQEVCPGVSIEGAKPAHGTQRRCAIYATVPETNSAGQVVIDSATGLPKMKSIIPDRVVRGFSDEQTGTSGRYIVDTIIVAPDIQSYAAAAAQNPQAAAAAAYATKYATYTHLLKPGDKLLAVVCESYGGLHDSVKERLLSWAELVRKADPGADSNGVISANNLTSTIMAIWQRRLSVALLHGRVNSVDTAMNKLRGVPSRSNTYAYRISHPMRFVQELGRLRERF